MLSPSRHRLVTCGGCPGLWLLFGVGLGKDLGDLLAGLDACVCLWGTNYRRQRERESWKRARREDTQERERRERGEKGSCCQGGLAVLGVAAWVRCRAATPLRGHCGVCSAPIVLEEVRAFSPLPPFRKVSGDCKSCCWLRIFWGEEEAEGGFVLFLFAKQEAFSPGSEACVADPSLGLH